MIPGIPFRQAVVSSDGSYIIVVTVDKGMKDCIAIYNATTGNYLHKVAFKGCNIKVCYPNASMLNTIQTVVDFIHRKLSPLYRYPISHLKSRSFQVKREVFSTSNRSDTFDRF